MTAVTRVQGMNSSEHTWVSGRARQTFNEYKGKKNEREELSKEKKELVTRQLVLLEAIRRQGNEENARLQKHQNELLTKLGESLKAEGAAMRAEGEALKAEGAAMQAEACHGILSKTLGKMIHEEIKKTTPLNVAGKKAIEVAGTSLKKFEAQNIQDLFTWYREKKCMQLNETVAQVILDIFKNCPCTQIDLTLFKDEVLPGALREVLSDVTVTKIIFSKLALECEAVKVAQEISRRRTLEIAFA